MNYDVEDDGEPTVRRCQLVDEGSMLVGAVLFVPDDGVEEGGEDEDDDDGGGYCDRLWNGARVDVAVERCPVEVGDSGGGGVGAVNHFFFALAPL